MKILYLTQCFCVHDQRFLAKLIEGGHAIYLLDLSHKHPENVSESVTCVETPDALSSLEVDSDVFLYLAAIEQAIAEINPDALHAGPMQTVAFAAALSGFSPLVSVSWGSDMLVTATSTPWNRWVTCFVLERSARFICDCQAVKAVADGIHELPDDAIYTFPWGIELKRYCEYPEFKIHKRRDWSWENKTVVISTRAWRPHYGIEDIIHSFARAYKQNPDLRLLLVGDGELKPEVEALIQEYKLSSVIHCPGMLAEEDVARYMSVADIYVCCTPSDGSSISLLEAMAMGLPAIATDNPGNREWVQDGVNGILINPEDHRAVAQAICSLANDSSLACRFGVSGRKIVEQCANWSLNSDQLLALYESLKSETTSSR